MSSAKKKIDLDFSLLLKPKAVSAFYGILDREKELEILKIPETLSRLKGASLLIGKAGEETHEEWVTRAYIRAGLSEFRSVEKSIRWDITEGKNHFTPKSSKNPLVHLMYRMRRVVVYKKNFDFKQGIGNYEISLGGELYPHKDNVYLIKNIKKCAFEEMKKHYKKEQLLKICKWFNYWQEKFGAPAIFSFGIMYYGHELLKYYSDRINNK